MQARFHCADLGINCSCNLFQGQTFVLGQHLALERRQVLDCFTDKIRDFANRNIYCLSRKLLLI